MSQNETLYLVTIEDICKVIRHSANNTTITINDVVKEVLDPYVLSQRDEKIVLLSQKLTAAEKRADYLERENARLNKLNGHLVAIHEGEE